MSAGQFLNAKLLPSQLCGPSVKDLLLRFHSVKKKKKQRARERGRERERRLNKNSSLKCLDFVRSQNTINKKPRV